MDIIHTLGPWVSVTDPFEPNKSGIYVAEGNNPWVSKILHNGEQMPMTQEANARIMAAAPELLAVAKAIIDQADQYTKPELLVAEKKAVDACYS